MLPVFKNVFSKWKNLEERYQYLEYRIQISDLSEDLQNHISTCDYLRDFCFDYVLFEKY